MWALCWQIDWREPGEKYLKKIPQPGEFNDLLSRQNSGDQFTLGSGVDFIQIQLRHGLRCELQYAFVKSALSNEVGSGAQRAAEGFIIA